MSNFDLLLKEIVDTCRINKIEFRWSFDDFTCSYRLVFKKLDKGLSIIINEMDLVMKPFTLIKTEIEHAINSILDKQELSEIYISRNKPNNFELLEKEINDLCNINKIQFKWQYDDISDNYIFIFRKLDNGFKLTISNSDIYNKPFGLIKTEVKHAIYEVIGY